MTLWHMSVSQCWQQQARITVSSWCPRCPSSALLVGVPDLKEQYWAPFLLVNINFLCCGARDDTFVTWRRKDIAPVTSIKESWQLSLRSPPPPQLPKEAGVCLRGVLRTEGFIRAQGPVKYSSLFPFKHLATASLFTNGSSAGNLRPQPRCYRRKKHQRQQKHITKKQAAGSIRGPLPESRSVNVSSVLLWNMLLPGL